METKEELFLQVAVDTTVIFDRLQKQENDDLLSMAGTIDNYREFCEQLGEDTMQRWDGLIPDFPQSWFATALMYNRLHAMLQCKSSVT